MRKVENDRATTDVAMTNVRFWHKADMLVRR